MTQPSERGRRFWILAGAAFLLGFGASVVALDRRGARVLAPPPSAGGQDRSAMAEPPPSTLGLEIVYDPDAVRRTLEERVPVRFGDLGERRVHPENRVVSYAVALEREPLELELRGDTVRLSAIVHYRGRVWLDSPLVGEITASCSGKGGAGSTPRAVVRLAAPLEIREDWRIDSSVRVQEVRPASAGERDRCRVALGPLRMDVTGPLLAAAESRARELAGELDAVIGALDLRSAVAVRWNRIQDPMRLAEDVWLHVEPDSLRVGAVRGRGPEGRLLTARLAVIGRPRIVVGARPPARRIPLPPVRREPLQEGFQALLEVRIEYPAAARLTSRALRDRELQVAGRAVRIDDVRLSGAGDGRVAMGLDVEGAVRGRLYLVGTPTLDPATGVITVPDLRFSVETRNLLLGAAAWLVRGGFPDRVQQAVRWDAERAVEAIRARAERGHDRSLGEGLRLRGSLGRVELTGVYASAGGLLVRSRMSGALTLLIAPPPVSPNRGEAPASVR